MKTHFISAALGLALVTSASAVKAQVLIKERYETFIVQPSGTLIVQSPLLAVSAVAVQPMQIVPSVERVRTVPARPVTHHQIVATRTYRVAANNNRPLYDMVTTRSVSTVTTPVVQTVATPVVQTVATPVVVAPSGLGLSGQFQCVQGCVAGSLGPAFVTQNGWELNLINEIGQPSRAWVDYPGHIWIRNWNEGAVYSPDGMTIQFDNGSVWTKNVVLLTAPLLR